LDTPLYLWVGFIAAVVVLLMLDLFVFHREAREITLRESGAWTVFWVTLSAAFGAIVWKAKGGDAALQFFTGYVVEYSLSMDNVFVIALIFQYFSIPRRYQHRVLFWGILGAVLMRGTMIIAGAAAIERFHWLLYVFGGILVFTGVKLLFSQDKEEDLRDSLIMRLCKRWFPITQDLHGQRFLVRQTGRLMLTPLALVLVMVETTDLIFAVDSIPAIFAITRDPFIVFTSNICAILGLRSLFFLLAGALGRFVFLRYGLAAILVFIGAKMLVEPWFKMHPAISLAVVLLLLGGTVAASLSRKDHGAS
jgi:tellurite resistance protein TerC